MRTLNRVALVAVVLAAALAPARCGVVPHRSNAAGRKPVDGVIDQYASLVTSMLMQKYSSHADASKALSNLVGVAGAHIDALDAQGMHDKLYFNWTAFTLPEFVTHILDYTQTIGDAVAAWLPDRLGFDHFATNYSQAYEPGLSISSAGFSYAPCIIGNFPVGAVVAPAAISISPLGVYITPEGANFQPEGVDITPVLLYIGGTGENIQPQGAIVAPTLVSVSPVRSQVGTSRFNASPIGISVGVAEAEEPNSTFSDGTAPGTLAGAGR